MCSVLLTTKRLILRRFCEDDADNLYALDNDPEVMQFLNGGIPAPRDVIQNEILPNFLHDDAQYPGYGFWAVAAKESGMFLGWLSLRATGADPGEAALGFRLRKSAWGNEYATEVAQAILHKGFTELGVQRVIATTYEKNVSSCRVLEKIGMKLARKFRFTTEDLMHIDSFYVDTLDVWDGYDFEYVLEKSEWERQQAAIG